MTLMSVYRKKQKGPVITRSVFCDEAISVALLGGDCEPKKQDSAKMVLGQSKGTPAVTFFRALGQPLKFVAINLFFNELESQPDGNGASPS